MLLPEEYAGKKGKCKSCGTSMIIPVPAKKTDLYKASPKVFASNPVVCILLVIFSIVPFSAAIDKDAYNNIGTLMCVSGIALVVLFALWFDSRCTLHTITSKNKELKKGFLGRHINDVRISDVRNIQITQSFFQRLLSVGNVEISSSGQSDIEIGIKGIPKPYEVRNIINIIKDES